MINKGAWLISKRIDFTLNVYIIGSELVFKKKKYVRFRVHIVAGGGYKFMG